LHAVIEPGNDAERIFRALTIDDVAAAEQRDRTDARRPAQKKAPRWFRQKLPSLLDQVLRVDAGDRLAIACHGALLRVV